MQIKFEQSTALKEGTKRLSPFFCLSCPSLIGMYTSWLLELTSGNICLEHGDLASQGSAPWEGLSPTPAMVTFPWGLCRHLTWATSQLLQISSTYTERRGKVSLVN